MRSCKQEKNRRWLWSLFQICIFVLVFILRTLYHLALQLHVSQGLARHRCMFSDALVRYSQGYGYRMGRMRLETRPMTLQDTHSGRLFGIASKQ